MKKKLIILVVLLIALGLGGYLVMGKNTSSPATPAAETGQPSQGLKSIMDLLAGGSQKCTFADSQSNTPSQGTIYVAMGKVRGDFNITTSGKTVSSHMIVDNPTMYLWMENQSMGFKMTIKNDDATQSGEAKTGGFDTQKKMDYKCQSWSVDPSFFALPANVQFTDTSSMMAPTTSGSPTTNQKAMQCASCSNLSGTQKSECLAALECQ